MTPTKKATRTMKAHPNLERQQPLQVPQPLLHAFLAPAQACLRGLQSTWTTMETNDCHDAHTVGDVSPQATHCFIGLGVKSPRHQVHDAKADKQCSQEPERRAFDEQLEQRRWLCHVDAKLEDLQHRQVKCEVRQVPSGAKDTSHL